MWQLKWGLACYVYVAGKKQTRTRTRQGSACSSRGWKALSLYEVSIDETRSFLLDSPDEERRQGGV